MHHALRAVVWDFDLTLADTRERNLAVTRRIVERVTGRPADDFPVLISLEAYAPAIRRHRNWQELYAGEFGLRPDELPEAARLWTEYQREEETPAVLFEGLPAALDSLRHLPHGIVSLNSRSQIQRVLRGAGLEGRFRVVIGYEEVRFHAQKPAPDGLLACVERLTGFAPGRVFYVGDHESDAECAAAANREMGRQGLDVRVVFVAAAYGAGDPGSWSVRPDHTARSPRDVVRLAGRYAAGTGR